MRRLVAGIDADGRSHLVEESDFAADQMVPGIGVATVYETTDPLPPPRPARPRDLLPMGLAPGRVRWLVMEWGAGVEIPVPMHHTDTVDLNFIVSGSCELVLDDGNHTCGAGDLVVVPGVDHSWINGPDGCVFNSVTVGTTPLD
jgi:hypothetical protein